MSIYLKSTPVGIDIVINNIQLAVANALGWPNYEAYHRVYKNQTATGVRPEFYKVQSQAKSGEYIETLLNDNFDASSFFYVDDTRGTVDSGSMNSTTLSMLFQVDLPEITGIKNSRNDEEIINKIAIAINGSGKGKVANLITGLNSVYSEFDISQVSLDDIQPYFVFRFDIDISYTYDCGVYTERVISDINGNPVVMY